MAASTTPTGDTTTAIAEEIVHAAAEMVARHFARSDARASAHTAGWSDDVWASAASTGWFDLLLDEQSGGLALGSAAMVGVFSLIGRELVPGPFLAHFLAAALLYPHASDQLAVELDRARVAASVVALADALASAPHPGALASIGPDGILTGYVPLVAYAERAQAFVVLAEQADGQAAALYIPRTAGGMRVEPRHHFDPAFPAADLHLDGVAVNPDLAFGPAQGGTVVGTVTRLRRFIRLAIAAELAGLARHLLDASVQYAKEREQFGRPIGAFQPVQHMLADMTIDMVGLEAYLADVAASDPLSELDAIAVKGIAARVARRVGEAALQVHGGIAFTAEFELHRWFLRVLSLQGHYGDDTDAFVAAGRALLADAVEH